MSDAPHVYPWETWRAGPDGVTFGACGVSGDRGLALAHLDAALHDEPGYVGRLDNATLDLVGRKADYIYGDVVIRGRHDAETGCVLWTKADEPALDPSFWPDTRLRATDAGSEP